MSKITAITLVLVSLFFSVSRYWFPSHGLSLWGTWEAAAHLYVGGLIGAMLMERRTVDCSWGKQERMLFLFFLAALPSLTELVMFLAWRLAQ